LELDNTNEQKCWLQIGSRVDVLRTL